MLQQTTPPTIEKPGRRSSFSPKTYPQGRPSETGQRSRILLHPGKPDWVVLNATAWEIAVGFSEGYPTDEIARSLRIKYSISDEAARRDVEEVAGVLLRGSFLDGAQGKRPARTPSMCSLSIHVTSRCNLGCLHCYVAPNGDRSPRDLPAERISRLLDELAGQGGGLVAFSGGEPLLHPHLKEILRDAAPSAQLHLATNGTLIDPEWARLLADLDVSVQVSLDGSQPRIHDAVRGDGAFHKALAGIDRLQEAGLARKITLAATVMGINLPDLENIIDLASRMGIPRVRFIPLRRVGRARETWHRIGEGISRERCEAFCRYTEDLVAKGPPAVEVSCGVSGLLLKMPAGCRDDMWCPVGENLVVDVLGDIYPCVLMMGEAFKLGNVFQDSLASALRSAKMQQVCTVLSERPYRIPKCASCAWRHFCQSGCMGQALNEKGTLWETDGFCDYRMGAYRRAFDRILQRADSTQGP